MKMQSVSVARDVPSGHATTRPLVLSSVLLAMTVLLIYLLISFPRPFLTVRKPISATTVVPVYSVPQPDNDPYCNLNDTFHRFQVPMFNVPYLYQLKLKVFLPWKDSVDFDSKNFTLEGISKMFFTVAKTNNRIQVHSTEQHISSLHIEDDFGRSVSVADISREFPHLLDIWTEHELIEHMNYSLHIKYKSKLMQADRVGIYAAEYTENGEKRWMAATHCQTQFARAIFPCLDTPEAKARFEATIEHPIGTTAVFNGKELDQVHEGNWTTTTFSPSPLMSTYLFAMTVSDFGYREINTEKVRIRVYVPKSKLNQTALAIWSLPKFLYFFEEYFEIPCPLNKLDVFGVPQLRVMGMENWGLITILLKHLLYDDKLPSPGQRRGSLELFAHEVAHQWFGNLVTMKWWNNLWLNEGFAVMMGQKAVEHLDGPSNWVHFLATELRHNQEPYSVAMSRKDMSFDPQSQFAGVYAKPFCIMYMVERVVGASSFRAGVKRFLQRFAYSNADHTDLMEALTYAHDSSSGSHLSGQPFSLNDFISTWIYQKGFPVVDVKTRPDGVQIVSQQAYRHTPGRPLPFDSLQWKIPLFYRHPITKEPDVKWLQENHTVAIDIGEDLVLNRQGTSFLRIRYDDIMYAKIIERLHTRMETIPSYTRARLIENAFTFAETQSISYLIPLNLTAYVIYEKYETFYGAVAMYNAHSDFLYSRLRLHPQFHILERYTITLLSPWFEKCHEMLKLEIPTSNQCTGCEYVYRRVCMSGFSRCIEVATEMVETLKRDCPDEHLSGECNSISACVRAPLYSAAVMTGNEDHFEFLFAKYETEPYIPERHRLWQGLATSSKAEHVHRMWYDALFVNLAKIRVLEHAKDYCKYYLYPNHFGSFFSKHLDKILKELNQIDFTRVVQALLRTVFVEEDLKEFLRIGALVEHRIPNATLQKWASRFSIIEQWKSDVGNFVLGNISLVLQSIEKPNSP